MVEEQSCFFFECIFQVEKIHSNNSIPLYLIQEGREVIRLRSTLQGLMERCSHISSELETFISDLASQKSVDSLDTSRSYVLKQPALLTSRLAKILFLYWVSGYAMILVTLKGLCIFLAHYLFNTFFMCML